MSFSLSLSVSLSVSLYLSLCLSLCCQATSSALAQRVAEQRVCLFFLLCQSPAVGVLIHACNSAHRVCMCVSRTPLSPLCHPLLLNREYSLPRSGFCIRATCSRISALQRLTPSPLAASATAPQSTWWSEWSVASGCAWLGLLWRVNGELGQKQCTSTSQQPHFHSLASCVCVLCDV